MQVLPGLLIQISRELFWFMCCIAACAVLRWRSFLNSDQHTLVLLRHVVDLPHQGLDHAFIPLYLALMKHLLRRMRCCQLRPERTNLLVLVFRTTNERRKAQQCSVFDREGRLIGHQSWTFGRSLHSRIKR